MKDAMTSVDVRAMAAELAALRDARVQKCYHIPPDEVRLELYSATSRRVELLVEAGRRVHLTAATRQAPQQPTGFAMALRKTMAGARVVSVEQYDFDRILRVDVTRADGGASMVVELFAQGNVVLLDDRGRITAALRTLRMRDRDVVRGEAYTLPPAQLSPIDATPEQLAEVLAASKGDLVRTLATRFNMGGLYAEETCLRAGLEKHAPAAGLGPREIGAVHAALRETFAPLLRGELRPQLVLKGGVVVDAVALDLLSYAGLERRPHPTFSAALEARYSAAPAVEAGEGGRADGKTPAGEARAEPDPRETIRRRLAHQEATAAEYLRLRALLVAAAEALYARYQEVEATLAEVRDARGRGVAWEGLAAAVAGSTPIPLERVDPARGCVALRLGEHELDLLVAETVPQAAQRLYDRAKELAAKVEGAERAMDETRAMLRRQAPRLKSRAAGVAPSKRRWYHRFRWFRSTDGFLVVGGLDADTNEELVRRYLEKRDVFLHAQAHGAPVVVVKAEGREVPETTLGQAAQLAVACSSDWEAGVLADDAFWVRPEQVSKTPQSGEYLAKGGFVIRGERNYLKNVHLRLGVGLLTEDGLDLVVAPPAAMAGARCWVELAPGRFARRDAAVKVYRRLAELAGPDAEGTVRKLLSSDAVERLLPRGGSDIVGEHGSGGRDAA